LKKDNNIIAELERKRDEYKAKYENYKKLALKEKEEKEAKSRDYELLKKERAKNEEKKQADP